MPALRESLLQPEHVPAPSRPSRRALLAAQDSRGRGADLRLRRDAPRRDVAVSVRKRAVPGEDLAKLWTAVASPPLSLARAAARAAASQSGSHAGRAVREDPAKLWT